jgi:hypothetical protein
MDCILQSRATVRTGAAGARIVPAAPSARHLLAVPPGDVALTQTSPESLDKAFALLVDHAVKGLRCPVTSGPEQHSFLVSAHISKLARDGRVFVEISTPNYRRITILAGEHKGKSTAANPNPTARVYQTVGKEGARINGKLVDHGADSRPQPSAPRFLTREELAR